MTPDPPPRRSDLPEWFPPWATGLADLYFSGTTAAFVLYGNTQDVFRVRGPSTSIRASDSPYGVLAEFLAEQLFGRWSLVLHYDLGRGLRAFAGRDEQRLNEMVPHVATIEVPLPDESERRIFIDASTAGGSLTDFSDFSAAELAQLTAGISLADLNVLVQSAQESRRRLDAQVFRALKKRLIERQCRGLLEFIEPKWTLDTVVGHEAAKARLREDAALLKRGALDTLPMGYLLCGPVGTGKSFLAQCVSGEIGIPCVVLKNFRSQYVAETEGNLEHVLSVLRAMGPVVVVVDEADAALGSREQDGDSGTSSRVFAMIAAQMGDTRYRGKIIWMLLTARPDLLPIDLKRQGRAEVHIPLFYPTDEEEIRKMFIILARKLGSRLAPEDVPAVPQRGHLSGADIEGMVGRAGRASLPAGADKVTT